MGGPKSLGGGPMNTNDVIIVVLKDILMFIRFKVHIHSLY